MKKWLLAIVLSSLIAPAAAHDSRVMELEWRVCGEVPCPSTYNAEPIPGPDSVPDPVLDPTPTGVPLAIAAMPPGSWLQYGAPWDEATPAVKPCGKQFKMILAAWNGWSRDGLNYIYVPASGGHYDGCDNGVYRYNIQTGAAELLVLHVELNAGLDTLQPFVADADGTQILPRSSHTYAGQYFEHPWLYQIIGAVYKTKWDKQVWRFHVEELRWERLPDRVHSTGGMVGLTSPYLIKTPDGLVLLGGWNICDADLLAGTYDCQKDLSFSPYLSVAYDPQREGIWHVAPRTGLVRFLRRVGGVWQVDDALSGPIPDGIDIDYNPGTCVVPDQGILVWSSSADLHSWDGTAWSVISTPGGPAASAKRKALNKWSWDDASQTCIGGWTTAEGLWVYKPGDLVEDASLEPDEPVEGVNLKAKWSIDRDNLPSIGGVAIQVAAWEPAPWDQSIERLPGAPDYDALCPGPWEERHYYTNADLAGTNTSTEGFGNVRVYLHPLKNAAGDVVAYTERITAKSDCFEVVGVPDAGRKPQLMNNINLMDGTGLIVRGVIMAEAGGECIFASRNGTHLPMVTFVVLQDSEFYACGGHVLFFGVWNTDASPTYLEMIGNVSAYSESHAQYNERSVGRFVYKSNICFAPGWGHCLKNLAHSSLIEGNVFANAGLDGQVAIAPSDSWLDGKTYTGGMLPLDLYACTQTIVRDNTFVYRTSRNVQTIMAHRPRGGWGGCNKGRRLAEDRWELLWGTDPAYQDPIFWAEVQAARALFDDGFEAARTSDVLFTHLVEDNRFIVLLAYDPDRVHIDQVTATKLFSLRPVAPKGGELAASLREKAIAQATLCVEAPDPTECFLSQVSEGVRYAYDHLSASWKKSLVKGSFFPNEKVPILAPEGWAERYAVYWGEQEGWACDAEGLNCDPWDVPLPRVPLEDWGHDAVKLESPPRVIEVN